MLVQVDVVPVRYRLHEALAHEVPAVLPQQHEQGVVPLGLHIARLLVQVCSRMVLEPAHLACSTGAASAGTQIIS